MSSNKKFTDSQVQKMREMYELGGCSLAKIATDFSVSIPTVSKLLKASGASIRRPGRPSAKKLQEVPSSFSSVDKAPEENVSEEPASIFRV